MTSPHLLAALLAIVAVLSPGSAWAQESPTPSPTPSSCKTSGSMHLALSPTRITAGDTVTLTAYFVGNLTEGSANTAYGEKDLRNYRWATPTTKAPAEWTPGQPAFQQVHNVPEGETWTRTWTLKPTSNTRLGGISYGYQAGCFYADSFFGLGSDNAIYVTDFVSPITAYRGGPRDYHFTGFFRGPSKTINLYRHHEGRRILTAQTRTTGETYNFHRRFTGSGEFFFSVATGNDIASTGASSPLRWTVIH